MLLRSSKRLLKQQRWATPLWRTQANSADFTEECHAEYPPNWPKELFVHEAKQIFRNPSVPFLYEKGLSSTSEATHCHIVDNGALCARSGCKTGRSPSDKRIVDEPNSTEDVHWGDINIRLHEGAFDINKQRALDFLNTRPHLYVIDHFANWHPDYRLKVRVICSTAYHALFMHNMMVRPTPEEVEEFEPDLVIYNSGQFPANLHTQDMSSSASVGLHLTKGEMYILGSMYAGEMKKGVFTYQHYKMPKIGELSLHSSVNIPVPDSDEKGASIFLGLSGTGKTTLSTDPKRLLIGDDMHVWSEDGLFNMEGGCYAKCVDLSRESEPEIYDAIRFGSVLENVVYDEDTREVDFHDTSITQNTRLCYPIEHIPSASIPCVTGHPTNIILLCCDAFGVVPPVSKLTYDQAMYHFISGYTAKVAGTEMGVTEPKATFSACFGEAFLVHHPARYAELLSDKLKNHECQAWLVNTGWVRGGYGKGSRMSLKETRAIITAIQDGTLADTDTEKLDVFNFDVPVECPGVESDVLMPHKGWDSRDEYDATLRKLAGLFQGNFKKWEAGAGDDILAGGPK